MDKFFSIEAMPLGNGVEKVAVFLNEQSDDIFPPTRVVVEHVPREKLIDIIRGMTQWINIRFEICEDCLREHFSKVAPIS